MERAGGDQQRETDFGHNVAVSSAGAVGWMQFMPATWARFGIDGDGDGRADPEDPADAIPAAARYLRAAGGRHDLHDAVFAYNHSEAYVQQVLAFARRYAASGLLGENPIGDPRAPIKPISPAAVPGELPAVGPACAGRVTGPAWLDRVITLDAPRSFAVLPSWAMAGGRPPEQVDARILPDALWILSSYALRVTAAREAGHHTHGDGTAVDLVPARPENAAAWDRSALRLAHDAGWNEGCASSGVAPACPLRAWVRFVGYNGYPGHGDPAHAGAMAHLHLSWFASRYGAGDLAPPEAWVRVFPAPDAADRAAKARREGREWRQARPVERAGHRRFMRCLIAATSLPRGCIRGVANG